MSDAKPRRGRRLRASAAREDGALFENSHDTEHPGTATRRSRRSTSGVDKSAIVQDDVHIAQSPETLPEEDDNLADAEAKPQPSVSERLKEAAAHVVDQVQDTADSAWQAVTGLSWPSLGILLLATVLTALLTARLAQPDLTKQQLAAIISNLDGLDARYGALDRAAGMEQALQQQLHTKMREAQERLARLEKEVRLMGALAAPADKARKGGAAEQASLGAEVVRATVMEHMEAYEGQEAARIRTAVRTELNVFNADKTNRTDYALHAAGGRVVGHSAVVLPPAALLQRVRAELARLLPGAIHYVYPQAYKYVLEPSMVPGHCLPLAGRGGHVDIRLRCAIAPRFVTLEHIPKGIAYNAASAPRNFHITGFLGAPLRFADGQLQKLAGEGAAASYDLGEFQYDVNFADAVQTFVLRAEGASLVDHVRVRVESNSGHPHYTCLYRIRIHGEPGPNCLDA